MARQPDVRYIQLYTDGSAARKIQPIAPVQNTVQAPRKRKQKRIVICVDPLALMALAVAAVMMVLMLAGVTKLHDQRTKTAQMEKYVESLQRRNDQLQEEYDAGYDLEEVERTAKALGMVPADQVKHVTVQVQTPKPASAPNAWEQFCTFLAGIFA